MGSLLFSPLELRGLRLRNRIVLSPMLTYSGQRGHVTDFHLMHLGKFAVGGTGLVFVESTKVDPRGCTTERDLGLWRTRSSRRSRASSRS
jgi:2,4-dienoyl-CoA reductase-like NADH-dependent reductase (Old Yellow Enzyme family)